MPVSVARRFTAGLPRVVGAGTLDLRAVHVLGIPFTLDISAIYAAGLGTWTVATTMLPDGTPGRTSWIYWGAGLLTATLVLLSIGLHEVGHCIAARRAGIGIRGVRLSLCGGCTEFDREPTSPRSEFGIAVAGLLASLVVAVGAALTHVALVDWGYDPLAASVAAIVASANGALVLLNALPALPLDGGYAARALLCQLGARRPSATRTMSHAGRGLGWSLLVLAAFGSASGDAAIALWMALLGLVLTHGRREASTRARVAATVTERAA